MAVRGLAVALCVGLVLSAGAIAGCAAPERKPVGEWRGPVRPAAFVRAPWSFDGNDGEVLTSENYRVYSTVSSPKVREKLLQLLEAGYLEYRKLVPTAPPTTKPMEAYLFGTRGEWVMFTRRNLGNRAAVFLPIQRGGYTEEDFFVAFYKSGGGGTEADLWSVTGHEGLHQFLARHTKGRVLPVMEEGLACLFEELRWGEAGDGAVPRFNTKVNLKRAQLLRTVLETRSAIPLEELIQLHAGRVVDASPMRLQAFYAEAWALARFLQEYDNGKYRPRLEQWLADTVTGEMFDPTGTHRRSAPQWDPRSAKTMVEHYLGTDMATLSKEFDRWCDYLAKEEISHQWNSR